MNGKADTQLATFNKLALHLQDEAFTLAYYLLGDESSAAEVTQAAFARIYQQPEVGLKWFRLEVLRRVLEQCRQPGKLRPLMRAREELVQKLLLLKLDERCALVLIDILRMDYEEAAQILHCSLKQIGKLLASGRLSLSRQPETNQPPAMV